MRAVSSNLMAGLLLIQALSGWCWQSARERIALEASAVQVMSTERCCDCEESGDEDPSQAPCKCRLECSGICTFVPPEKTQLDLPQLVVGFDHLAVAVALADSQIVSAFWTEVAGGPSELKSQLPLYLLHQILLI